MDGQRRLRGLVDSRQARRWDGGELRPNERLVIALQGGGCLFEAAVGAPALYRRALEYVLTLYDAWVIPTP